MTASPLEERIAILAPSAHDGPITHGILTKAGFHCLVVSDLAELCQVVQGGVAALLIANEGLSPGAAARPLLELLGRQEPWSDLPIILFAGVSSHGAAYGRPSAELLAQLGNVTLLDRPVQLITLVSTVQAAVRARHRQYAARAVLAELQAVLDAVPAAVFITRDRGGRHMSGNRYAAELLRVAPGVNLSKSAPPGEQTAEFRVLRAGEEIPPQELPVQRAAAGGGEVRNYEFELALPGGTRRHMFGNATPLTGAGGAPAGAVGAFLDVTEMKRAEEELREADRRKTEFLAMLSHELRNPLAPIRNSIHVLERAAPASDAARRALDVLRRQADHLSRLVNDLLDITRITHGKMELQPSRLDVRELVRRAWEDARALFEQRQVDLVLSQAEAPLWVDADADRLFQMLGNLLSNALKFTPPGGEVRLACSRSGDACAISVTDTGLGIDAEDLERIFSPFVQPERTRHGHGGLGLGLALVHELATRQGGTVRATSGGTGKGAAFVIELPSRPPPAAEPEPARSVAGARASSVLVVEDNEDAAASLADLLRLDGHQVTTAGSGYAGIEAVAAARPEVLICDIGLPDMSGLEVIRAVRASTPPGSVYAIAVSGYAQAQDRKSALEAGFDLHLPKPPPLEVLRRHLRERGRQG